MRLPTPIQDKLIDIGSMVLKQTSLDKETKVLIAVATSVACYCSHSHGEFKIIARKLGLSSEQIEEAEDIGLRMREKGQNSSGLFRMKLPV